MATTIVEGFSISHAAILNGTTGAEEAAGDIYGVREGSIEPDIDNYDNQGDDNILSTWFWWNFATVSITSGYIPFPLIALLTGTTIVSSGVAPADHNSIPLWTEGEFNVAPRPMLIRVPSKDSNGVPRRLDIVLYKVQFQPISFDGPSYKDGMLVNYSGKSLMSSVDEAGVSLASRAIGRLISRPAA